MKFKSWLEDVGTVWTKKLTNLSDEDEFNFLKSKYTGGSLKPQDKKGVKYAKFRQTLRINGTR